MCAVLLRVAHHDSFLRAFQGAWERVNPAAGLPLLYRHVSVPVSRAFIFCEQSCMHPALFFRSRTPYTLVYTVRTLPGLQASPTTAEGHEHLTATATTASLLRCSDQRDLWHLYPFPLPADSDILAAGGIVRDRCLNSSQALGKAVGSRIIYILYIRYIHECVRNCSRSYV